MREWYVCGIVVAITTYNEQTIKIVHMQLKKIIASALEAGMTQQQIGELVGCKQSTIGKIANGDTEDPRWSTVSGLLRLAAAKGINVDWGEMGLYFKVESSDEPISSDGHVMRQEGDPPLVKELQPENEHPLLEELQAIHVTLKALLEPGGQAIVVGHVPDKIDGRILPSKSSAGAASPSLVSNDSERAI